jgi:hypothetical protein
MGKIQKQIDKFVAWLYNSRIVTNKVDEKMELITKLDKLSSVVAERYPTINYGGCGVFAALVVTELKKHNIHATGIVAAYDADEPDGPTIDTVRPQIKKKTNVHEWNNNGISFYHVGVEFKIGRQRKHYDSTGVKTASKMLDHMPIYKGRLERDELRALASKQSGWNVRFDRSNIPALRRLVKKHLEVKVPKVVVKK